MERRGILKALLATVAAAWSAPRSVFAQRGTAAPAAAPVPETKHIRLYVEMDVPPAREREMLETFHNVFVPEAVKHAGYVRVKMLKRRTILQGTAPAPHNYRFELEFESEELRQQWIASAGHQRVWPQVERCMTTLKDYPVVLYDEV